MRCENVKIVKEMQNKRNKESAQLNQFGARQTIYNSFVFSLLFFACSLSFSRIFLLMYEYAIYAIWFFRSLVSCVRYRSFLHLTLVVGGFLWWWFLIFDVTLSTSYEYRGFRHFLSDYIKFCLLYDEDDGSVAVCKYALSNWMKYGRKMKPFGHFTVLLDVT